MGKALLVGTVATVGTGQESNLFGSSSNATEANSQYSATEGASFTKLGIRITAGGDGTNTCQFRDAGINGQNVVSFIGIGTGEDGANTDTLTAGDLFNLALTSTGTSPDYAWAKANVEFTSGHGCFHASASYTAPVFDVASSTRYLPISGQLAVDGQATIANVQWKNRGYTSIEAFQVRVIANARTNNSILSINVNGTDVGTAITYAAAATGLQTVTGMGLSLADGDLICISLTLGTGIEDLTIAFVGVTLKSTSGASDAIAGNSNGFSRTASATPTYYCIGGSTSSSTATETDASIKVGFAARCKNLRCYLSANTYTGAATLKLMVNGVAQITTTITASGGAGWYENAVDTFDIDADDLVSFEIDEGTSGSITGFQVGVTFAEIPILNALMMMGVGV